MYSNHMVSISNFTFYSSYYHSKYGIDFIGNWVTSNKGTLVAVIDIIRMKEAYMR
jgi:hypothetical protein